MGDLVKIICSKLEIKDTALIRKASEYERLTRLRMSAAGGGISNSALPVVCIDLAAGILALPFDFESALRLAAVKKTVYTKNKHTIEKLLNIQASKTVGSMCIQLECAKATETAEKLLKRFQDTNNKNVDLSHPQYMCMAIYQACKIEKVKVSKSKFLSLSHLKLSQWNELDTQWRDLVAEYTDSTTKKKGSSKNDKEANKGIIEIADKENSENIQDIQNEEVIEDVEKIEPYEIWKQRILEEAHKELEKIDEKLNNSM